MPMGIYDVIWAPLSGPAQVRNLAKKPQLTQDSIRLCWNLAVGIATGACPLRESQRVPVLRQVGAFEFLRDVRPSWLRLACCAAIAA
jgi:hypothetical protein